MSQFVSGSWTGYYAYSGRNQKYPMDLVLEFKRGAMTGEGYDSVGGFVIAGVYSTDTLECSWQKTYVRRHTVEYRGFAEDHGIWGTWTLPGAKGGFKIWPVSEGGPMAAKKEEEPVKERAEQATRRRVAGAGA